MNRFLVVAAALLVSVLTLPAEAARDGDPEDADGRLDIGLTRFVEPEEDIAQLTIVTYESWGCAHLGRGKKTTLEWLIDGSGGRDFDLVGTFHCRQKTLLFDLRSTDGANRYESIEVRRRGDSRTALVRFPMDLQEFDGGDVSVVAKSSDRSGETCTERCHDRAPDSGRLRRP